MLAGAGTWSHLLDDVRAAHARRQRRPNVVLVLADDLGYGELGCYGQQRIVTPHLDRLAGEGVRFTDCYAGAPVCAPSRCSLLTGMHTGHSRVRTNYGRIALGAQDVTVGEVLQAAGYRTAFVGKWGFGPDDPPESGARTPSHPNARGFDEFFGYLGHRHAHDHYPDHLWQDGRRVPVPENQPNGPAVQHRFGPDLLLERALDFIGRTGDAPFLLVLAFPLPHAPNDPPDDGPYAQEGWPAGERAHAAQVTLLDRYVGQVVAALAAAGAADDSLVLVTSDNGPHDEGGDALYAGEDHGRTHDPAFFDAAGPLRGIKRSLYEGGIRVPMIAWGPGLLGASGTTDDTPWAFADVLPTLADLAGIAPPEDVDGVSRVAALVGGARTGDRPLYWYRLDYVAERSQLADAVRLGRWKAIRFAPVPPPSAWRADPDGFPPGGADAAVELYDLVADPGETHDLAAAHPDVVAALVAEMDAAWAPVPFERRPWVPAPPPGGVPAPRPGSGGPGSSGAPRPRLVRGGLALTVPKRRRKAAKGDRSLQVGLASAQRITDVEATLFRYVAGERITVARGRVAVVEGRATLRLRVVGRIRPRRHTLRLVGRNADGTRADRRIVLRFT